MTRPPPNSEPGSRDAGGDGARGGDGRGGDARGAEFLLDLVEDRLDPIIAAAAMQRLPEDGRRAIDAMRRDRSILAGIPDEQAPAGLAAAVLARVEREALADAQLNTPRADAESDSSTRIAAERDALFEPSGPRSPARAFFDDAEAAERIGRGSAAARAGSHRRRFFATPRSGLIAAGLLLIVGGATYLAAIGFSGGGTPAVDRGEIALQPGATPTTTGTTAGTTADAPRLAANNAQDAPAPSQADTTRPIDPSPTRLAMETAPARPAPLPTDRSSAAPSPTATMTLASAAADADRPAESPRSLVGSSALGALAAADRSRVIPADDLDRAVAAAREGRLMIRVRTGEPESARRVLAAIAEEKQPASRAWRLAPATQPDIIAAATAGVPTLDQRMAMQREELARKQMVARVGAPPTFAFLNIQVPRPRFDPRENGGVFLLDVPATIQAIATARTVLADNALGGGLPTAHDGTLELVELAEPVRALPSMQVESVMWWQQAPSGWTSRASVPVVIEEK